MVAIVVLIEVILVLIGVLIEVILVAYLPQCNPSAPHLCLKTGQDLSERVVFIKMIERIEFLT